MESHICHYGDKPAFKPLANYDLIDLADNKDYEFIPGHRYLILGSEAYDVIVKHQKIHLGPRREGFYDLTRMDYVLTRSGLIFKFGYINYERKQEWINEDQYKLMLRNIDKIKQKIKGASVREVYSKKKDRNYWIFEFEALRALSDQQFKFMTDKDYIKAPPRVSYYKCIRLEQDIINAFRYLIDQEYGRYFGFDYETCGGFPFDSPTFSPMGLGIADQSGVCAYFDIEYIRDCTNYYQTFINLLIEFLDKHAKNTITYNVGFELRVTYLLTKKMYELGDASTINLLEGDNDYRRTLKYTAMRHCHVESWDDDFEASQELLYDLMNKNTVDNFTQSNEWHKLITTYPGHNEEFIRLIKKNWGDEFGCIPYEILGKYCCMDAYYTVLLRIKAKEYGYSELAWQAFDYNNRMGAHLDMNGVVIDEETRKKYIAIGNHFSCYGRLNTSKLFLSMELEDLGTIDVDIPVVSNCCRKSLDIFNSKELLRSLLDPTNELGINTSKLYDAVQDATIYEHICKVVKDYFGKIDSGCFRSRSAFNNINDFINGYLQVKRTNDSLSIVYNNIPYSVNISYEKIYRYYRLKEQEIIVDYYLKQLHIDDIVESLITPDGGTISIADLDGWIKGTINNIDSNNEITDFIAKWLDRYKYLILKYKPFFVNVNSMETVDDLDSYSSTHSEDKTMAPALRFIDWLIRILNEIVKSDDPIINARLDYYNKLYSDDKKFGLLNTISKDLNLLKPFIENYKIPDNYHCEGFCDFKDISNAVGHIWGVLNGGQVFDRYIGTDMVYILNRCSSQDGVDYHTPLVENLDNIDITSVTFDAIFKLSICYKIERKYNKLTGTYLMGMFHDTARWCLPYDENAVSVGRWGEGNVWKCFPHYDVCEKKSKRWSSNFHTIPSHSEIKRCVAAPKGYLLTYFDISGMEVRTLSYLANDDFMLNNYAKGVDPYIDLAKRAYPGHEEGYYWGIRSDMKTTLLGSLYGMGVMMMAERTEKTPEEAQELLDTMFTYMDDIKKLIEHKGKYPDEHDGYVETILGDKISLRGEPHDRWSRLGNNLCIQGGSAVLMAYGFEHIIQDSFDRGYPVIRPINVVHDSSQNYVSSDYIFDIHKYYKSHLTDFLFEKVGISYEFDTLIGVNYYDLAKLKVVDDNTIKLKGTYLTLRRLLDRLDEDGVKYNILSLVDENTDVECYVDGRITEDFHPIMASSYSKQFYQAFYSAVYESDNSEFTLKLGRVI